MTSSMNLEYEIPSPLFVENLHRAKWLELKEDGKKYYNILRVENHVEFLKYCFFFYKGNFQVFYNTLADDEPFTHVDWHKLRYWKNWYNTYTTLGLKFRTTALEKLTEHYKFFTEINVPFQMRFGQWNQNENTYYWNLYLEKAFKHYKSYEDLVIVMEEHFSTTPFPDIPVIVATIDREEECETKALARETLKLPSYKAVQERNPIKVWDDEKGSEVEILSEKLCTMKLPEPPTEEYSHSLNDYFSNAPNIFREALEEVSAEWKQ